MGLCLGSKSKSSLASMSEEMHLLGMGKEYKWWGMLKEDSRRSMELAGSTVDGNKEFEGIIFAEGMNFV